MGSAVNRRRFWLPRLLASGAVLAAVARAHSLEMLNKGHFAHEDGRGRNLANRVEAAGMARCRLIVAIGWGAKNLAAATGIPLVAIFGSADERATGPLATRVRIVKKGVECSPCGKRECPIDFRCMADLSVEEVYRATLEFVKDWNITHE
jgi:hypothetical protein